MTIVRQSTIVQSFEGPPPREWERSAAASGRWKSDHRPSPIPLGLTTAAVVTGHSPSSLPSFALRCRLPPSPLAVIVSVDPPPSRSMGPMVIFACRRDPKALEPILPRPDCDGESAFFLLLFFLPLPVLSLS